MDLLKRILYFCLGLIAFLSLLCSVAATCVTNESLLHQGFLQYSQTAHLNVPASRYGDYARAIGRYLDGETAAVQVRSADSGEMENAFSEKENLHLADVKGIVTALKAIRWAGGALVILCLAALFFKHRERPAPFLADAVRGFALAALFLLAAAAGLAIWGAVNFDGLFWTFHQVSFANDLWLLNPQTDLLVALMPLPFFTWYAGEMLKSMLPVLGMTVLIPLAWLHLRKNQKEPKTA